MPSSIRSYVEVVSYLMNCNEWGERDLCPLTYIYQRSITNAALLLATLLTFQYVLDIFDEDLDS